MNTPENVPAKRKARMSAEAVIGTGVTLGMIGVLFLLLGWAQHMREVKEAAWILLPLGAALFLLGAIMALSGGVMKYRAADFQRLANQ